MEQIHYLNGSRVAPPSNYRELSIELNFNQDSEERAVSVTRWNWINSSAKILKDILTNGMNGGTGVFVGVTHRIDIIENRKTENLFNGYIDLTTADFNRDLISVDSIAFDSPDFITEKADGFTFENLFASGELTDNDKIFVPYVISSIPAYSDAFLVIFTLTFVTIELKQLINDLSGKGVESGTYIGSVGGIVGLVFKIIYAILLTFALVELILQMVSFMIQKVKYRAGMSLNKQLEAGALRCGLKYECVFLQNPVWSKAHIIPAVYNNPITESGSQIKGFFRSSKAEQTGYYKGTFGDLLRAVKTMFNARIVIDKGILKIVPLLKTATRGTFQLPNYYNPEFRTNADSLISNYLISFRYDSNEKNTIDNWEGNNMQSTLLINNSSAKKLQLMSGFKQVSIPFARGTRKDKLTEVEEVIESLLDVVGPVFGAVINTANKAINTINKIFDFIEELSSKLSVIGINIDLKLPDIQPVPDPKLQDILDNRIGMLQSEKDIQTVDKIVLLDVNSDDAKTKISSENSTYIHANYLYENFHYTNSFKAGTESAQRYRLEYKNVEMNLSDFLNVQKEGLCKTPTGKIAEVLSCSYNPATRLADFKITERKLYSNNITEKINVPTGR
jgi:hypothetical protein